MMFLKLLLRCSSSFISFFLLVFVSCTDALFQRIKLLLAHSCQHPCSVLVRCGHAGQENLRCFSLHARTDDFRVSANALPSTISILKVCFLANEASRKQHPE